MRALWDRLQNWRKPAQAIVPVAAYAVPCACGQVFRGARQATFRAIRCGCGRDVFVLPTSPLPPVPDLASERPSTRFFSKVRSLRPSLTNTPRPWRSALVAAVLLLTACLVIVLVWPRGHTGLSAEEALAAVRERVAAGARELTEGNYQQAVASFDAAARNAAHRPNLLPPREARQLAQLRRQAALLADLSTESLGEMLTRAGGLEEREWQAFFERRYKDRAIVFDAVVRRDAAGRYEIDYAVFAGDEPARLELDGLDVLNGLPLEQPRRLLFGARLEIVSREGPGPWVVRFVPNSGVLLTQPAALGPWAGPMIDPELAEVLNRQAEWIADAP